MLVTQFSLTTSFFFQNHCPDFPPSNQSSQNQKRQKIRTTSSGLIRTIRLIDYEQTITLILNSLAHRRSVSSLSRFYRYYHDMDSLLFSTGMQVSVPYLLSAPLFTFDRIKKKVILRYTKSLMKLTWKRR